MGNGLPRHNKAEISDEGRREGEDRKRRGAKVKAGGKVKTEKEEERR